METKFSREELYNLVWSTPLSVLSKIYNISDNGLRKMCERMNIPLPKGGYWQRIKHGKKPRRIELPDDHTNHQTISLEFVTENTIRVATVLGKIKMHQKIIEAELGSSLIVPEKLYRPDQLVVGFRERFEASEKRDWSSKVYDLHPYALDIVVTKLNLPRALMFFDTIIKALKIRGYSIGFEHKHTHVDINGEKIEIRLREKNKITKEKNSYGLTSNKYEPTGILYFGVKASYHDRTWSDGDLKIEKYISNILAYIEIKGEELHQRTIKWENEKRIEEEKRKNREEFQKLQDNELAKFKSLLHDVERWKKLKDLRAYISELESSTNDSDTADSEILEKINWMKSKADWFDPTISGNDELFHGLDKNTLKFDRKEYW